MLQVPLLSVQDAVNDDADGEEQLWWGETVIPEVFYEKAMLAVVNEEWALGNEELTKRQQLRRCYAFGSAFGRAAAPAWRLVALSLWLTWIVYLVGPILTNQCLSCDGSKLALMPKWVPALYLPAIGLSLYFEMKAYKWIFPIEVHFFEEYKILGKMIPGATAYWMQACGSSWSSHFSFATNAFFLARVWHSVSCGGDAAEVWRHLAMCTAAVYALGLCKLAYGIAYGIPFSGDISVTELMQEQLPAVRSEQTKQTIVNTLVVQGETLANVVDNLSVAGNLTMMNMRRNERYAILTELLVFPAARMTLASDFLFTAVRSIVFLLLDQGMHCVLKVAAIMVSTDDGVTQASIALNVVMIVMDAKSAYTHSQDMQQVLRPFCNTDDENDYDEKLGGCASGGLAEKRRNLVVWATRLTLVGCALALSIALVSSLILMDADEKTIYHNAALVWNTCLNYTNFS